SSHAASLTLRQASRTSPVAVVEGSAASHAARAIARTARSVAAVSRPGTGRGSARRGDHPALGIEGRLPAADGLQLRTRDLVPGVIAGADERRGLDVLEPEPQ